MVRRPSFSGDRTVNMQSRLTEPEPTELTVGIAECFQLLMLFDDMLAVAVLCDYNAIR